MLNVSTVLTVHCVDCGLITEDHLNFEVVGPISNVHAMYRVT